MVNFYADRLASIYGGSPWYGDSLMSKLRDVNAANAFVSPQEGIHTIAQIVAHMVYWRKALISRLIGDDQFKASEGSADNWPSLPELREVGWDGIRAALDETQGSLKEILTGHTDDLLTHKYDKEFTYDDLIQGIIDHDIYHIGQIGLVKKLLSASSSK